jgi:exopolyphosphatase/guanosine-5'-triphosphate,3'-diphosphate pyrophosphatase
MTRDRITGFISQFSKMSLEERRKIPGIGYRRAEIILPGTILIRSLLDCLGRDLYLTSERGLRYGLLINSGNANNFA